MASSCGLLSVGLVLDRGPNARSRGATVRLERERISKESLGTSFGMSCDGRNDCLPAVRVASAAAWNSMVTVISLREVIETLEMQCENCVSYVDPDTGEIVTATEEVRRLAEEPEESQNNLPEWQREMVRKVRAMLTSSCRTASGFMSGLLGMNSQRRSIANRCGRNCWRLLMGQAPFGCFRVRSGA